MVELSILIPTYNEIKTIDNILKKIDAINIEKEIIIVDDGSSDGTKEYLSKLSKRKYNVLFHKKNMGKGAAIKTGLKYASKKFFIIQDADLEYHPSDYINLLDLIMKKNLSVVYGSRFRNKNNQKSNQIYFLGNFLLSFSTRLLYGHMITDMETCYKLFRTDFLKRITINSNGFDFEAEVTAKVLKKGVKINEVPIKYSPRSIEEGKKITYLDGFKAIWTLLRYRF